MWYINMQNKISEKNTPQKHTANSVYDTKKRNTSSSSSPKKFGTKSSQPGSKPPNQDSSLHGQAYNKNFLQNTPNNPSQPPRDTKDQLEKNSDPHFMEHQEENVIK